MNSLVLLVCSLLLLVIISHGQDINCNLRNGAGCFANGPHFYLQYKLTHPGPSNDCRRAYDLRVNTPSIAKGFECSFVTEGVPQRNIYRYTISHSPDTYRNRSSAYVRAYENYAQISMADGPSSGVYYNNYWRHPNMHASSGSSWAHYRFETQYLSYYSSNTGIQYQSGHPYGFTPLSKPVYIGLNRDYNNDYNDAYGLCQVYCRIITSSIPDPPRSSNTVQGAAGSSGENLSAPITPSRPPPPPTGSGN